MATGKTPDRGTMAQVIALQKRIEFGHKTNNPLEFSRAEPTFYVVDSGVLKLEREINPGEYVSLGSYRTGEIIAPSVLELASDQYVCEIPGTLIELTHEQYGRYFERPAALLAALRATMSHGVRLRQALVESAKRERAIEARVTTDRETLSYAKAQIAKLEFQFMEAENEIESKQAEVVEALRAKDIINSNLVNVTKEIGMIEATNALLRKGQFDLVEEVERLRNQLSDISASVPRVLNLLLLEKGLPLEHTERIMEIIAEGLKKRERAAADEELIIIGDADVYDDEPSGDARLRRDTMPIMEPPPSERPVIPSTDIAVSRGRTFASGETIDTRQGTGGALIGPVTKRGRRPVDPFVQTREYAKPTKK